MSKRTIEIKVPALARVEGEGALEVNIQNGTIEQLQLRIYEPPRYFEKFLEGRDYNEVPDIVARICGICPVAYQMSATQALESIFHVQPSPWIENLRRVMYCGEWIQSHSLHIHLLAAPDFLGCSNIAELAQKEPQAAHRGLQLQALGNKLIELCGARSVHPMGVRVGGFSHAPATDTVQALLKELEQALPEAEALVHWTASLDLPDEQREFICVALRHEQDYPMNHGRLLSNRGLDLGIEEFEQYFTEQHVPQSTALHCLLNGEPYLLGPLARLNLNADRLPQATQAILQDTGLQLPSYNMFHSIIARAIEVHAAMVEAIRLLGDYAPSPSPLLEVNTTAGTGFGCTEAPRGLLWHRYSSDAQGHIESARIVPPTSQNQARIEQDLHDSLSAFGLSKPIDDLRLHGEKIIRNYDPCISCATHFLKLNLNQHSHVPEKDKVDCTGRWRIIGIGSPMLADQLGWQVIDALRDHAVLSRSGNIELISLDRPGMKLLDYLDGDAEVILIDAISADAEPGRLVQLSATNIETDTAAISSHKLGVVEVLGLARQLGRPLAHVQILGLVRGEAEQPWSAAQRQGLIDAVLACVASN